MVDSSDNRAIGVFDSGLGGLSVLNALKEKYPKENFVYLGDTARVPYGNKSKEAVCRYAVQNARFLAKTADLKLLVVACNTASACALGFIEKELDCPVVGVIEPSVSEIIRKNNPINNKILLLATQSTVSSKSYEKALEKLGFCGEISSKACGLFVPIVEEGLVDGDIAQCAAKYYLSNLDFKPDTVILGCTHYPYLLPMLKKTLRGVTWINSAEETAKALKFTPRDSKKNKGQTKYYVTDSPERFKAFGGLKENVEQVDLSEEYFR